MNETEKITLNEYELTNIDLKNHCFTIRLKNNEEYIVYSRKKDRRKVYFIEKDGKEIVLDDDVKKCYISEVRLYNRVGI